MPGELVHKLVGDVLVSASPLVLEILDSEMCATEPDFIWILWI